MASDRIKLGGLWLNKSKDGREYLTGKLSPTVKILIFKNDFKTTDNQPSHVMYLAPVETDETQRQPTQAPGGFFGDPSGDAADEADGLGGSPGSTRNGSKGGDGGSGDDFADDDYIPAEEALPSSPPPAREAAATGNRLVPSAQGRAQAQTSNQAPNPAQGQAQGPRRPSGGSNPSSPP